MSCTLRQRAMRACLVLAVVAVAMAGCRTGPRIDGPPPSVEFRLAEFEPVDGFTAMRSRHGETLYVASETVVDLEDIHTSLLRRQGDDDFLLLNVKAGSRMRLDAATMAHLERPVVVLVDDEIVYAPILRTSISRQVPVRVGSNGVTLAEAKRILEAVADQRDFGPWSARSGLPDSSRAGRFRAARAAEAAGTSQSSSDAAPGGTPSVTEPAPVTAPPSTPPKAPDRER